MSGKFVLGSYEVDLVNPLGQGTFGVVYPGKHVNTNAKCAVKRITIDTDARGGEALKEIKNFQHLGNHPHIVKLLDFNFKEQSFWMMMEFCDKGDLNTHYKKNTHDFDFNVGIMYQCVSAINYMHTLPSPIVHRDIKPENVMLVEESGKLLVKVTDFGLSKIVEQQDLGRTALFTSTAGTPGFMAPEFFSKEPYSKSVDVFALGLMILALLKHKKGTPLIPQPDFVAVGIIPIGAIMHQNHATGAPQHDMMTINGDDKEKVKTVKELINKMTVYDRKKRLPLREVEPVLQKIAGNLIAKPKFVSQPSTDETNEAIEQRKGELRPAVHGSGEPGRSRTSSQTSTSSMTGSDSDNIPVKLLRQALDAKLKEQLELLTEGATKRRAKDKYKEMNFVEKLAHVIGEGKGHHKINIGDTVIFDASVDEAIEKQEHYGGWNDHMKKYIKRKGKVKERVLHVLKVSFGDGHLWSINPDLLKPVHGDEDVNSGDLDIDPIEGIFRRGDIVKVHEDEGVLKLLNDSSYGGWNEKMRRCLGVKGIVNRIHAGGGVRVECINGDDWTFNPEVLVKVDHSEETIENGDFVIIGEDRKKLIEMQEGHGGWTKPMEKAVGKAGIVMEVLTRNRARVEVGGGKWIYNTDALRLVAKGEEMLVAIMKKENLKIK